MRLCRLTACAVAGTYLGVRARYDSLPGDPIFVEATGYETYRTSGQRAATRAAISMPDDGTLIALLPTGSGKTEVAITLAHLARRQTTLVVVPTVALAYDFERRFRAVFGRLNPRVKPDELAFAWTGETDVHGTGVIQVAPDRRQTATAHHFARVHVRRLASFASSRCRRWTHPGARGRRGAPRNAVGP